MIFYNFFLVYVDLNNSITVNLMLCCASRNKDKTHRIFIFRLYNSLNLTYPPALAGMASSTEEEGAKGGNGHVEALNQSLHRTVLPEEVR